MEKWAERIKQRLDAGRARGLTQTGLAKACGVAQPSVSQWFNDNDTKPATKMILGDNLIAAARYLGVSPEWIVTGHGQSDASQSVGLDLRTLQTAIVSVKEALRRAELELDAYLAAPMIAFAYRERLALPADLPNSELPAFDDVVWQKLQGELGNARQTGPVAKAGERGHAKAAAPKAKARGCG
jgi:transcriptional regulator with XRE-family HTH domain